MTFSLPLISILMSWISYQTATAHPFGGMFPGSSLGGIGGGMPGIGGMPGMAGGPGGMGGGLGRTAGGNSIKTDLSDSCKTAVEALSKGELATCANIPALVAISKAEGSIVPAINTYVTGACSAVPCSQQALASAAGKFKNECQKDLDDGSAPAVGIYSHLLHYKEAR
ncbi:hypothetical protein MJO29_010006 [Puccinia striiformis f. sp. tritici]|nr:hypothetical protein MJO29_010006 [Puccinia striiformis f. sp. tritici]